MGSISTIADKSQVLNWIDDKTSNAQPRMNTLIEDILNLFLIIAQALAPIKEGTLAGSHIVEVFGLEGWMYPTVVHATFIILGVDHEWTICPINKKSLYWEGLDHPLPIGRCVTHPPMTPNPYMDDTMDAGLTQTDQLLSDYGDWMVS
jgi:hypothetical protein